MFIVAISLLVIICLLLVLVILVQNSKGGGVAAGFDSSSSNLIGVKKTSDLLENITWGLAISLLIGCLATNFIIDRDGNGQAEQLSSPNIERAQESGFAPQQPQPSQNSK
jgi:preprotein translocase subunit SecG